MYDFCLGHFFLPDEHLTKGKEEHFLLVYIFRFALQRYICVCSKCKERALRRAKLTRRLQCVFSPVEKTVLTVIKASVNCDVSRVYTEGLGRSSLLLAAEQKSVLDYKWISSSAIASLIGVLKLELLCPLCGCAVADVSGQKSSAYSQVLVNGSWLVGGKGWVEDHKGRRSVECLCP
jgi:hypothetical protein